MDKSNYIDKTIIRLQRQYSKDELVQAMTKKLSDLGLKVGVLESELVEYKYYKENYKKIESLEKENKELKEKLNKATSTTQSVRRECKKERQYQQLENQFRDSARAGFKLKMKIKELEKQNTELLKNMIKLQVKTNK